MLIFQIIAKHKKLILIQKIHIYGCFKQTMLSFFEATCHKSAQGSPYLLWIFFSNLSQRLVSHGFFPWVFPWFPSQTDGDTSRPRRFGALGDRPVPASPHRLQWHDIFHHHLPGSASGLCPAKIDMFLGYVNWSLSNGKSPRNHGES